MIEIFTCQKCGGETSSISPRCSSCGNWCTPLEDKVNHPTHYNQARVECIDIIEDLGLNYHEGCAIKYIWRAGTKDPARYSEDLRKAVWYLNRAIEYHELTKNKHKN